MQLKLVSFETAKQLKEVGFDLDIMNIYSKNGIDRFTLQDIKEPDIAAPTLALVQTWLMEKHKMFALPILENLDDGSEQWVAYLYPKNKGCGSQTYGVFKDYDKALEEAIIGAIELIKT